MATAPKTKLGFNVIAAGDTLVVDIFDEIGGGDGFFSMPGVSARDVRAALAVNPNASIVRVRINSEGGDVFEGMSIYNALAAHPGKKIVEIDTLAASIASIIMMAGDERRITENGMVMIHNPSADNMRGESQDLRSTADVLDKLKENMVAIYTERTGQKTAKVTAAMDAETWMTADEAKAAGYVHKIMAPAQLAARAVRAKWNLAKFHNIPDVFKVSVAAPDSIEHSNDDTSAPTTPAQKELENKRMEPLTGKDVEIAGALLALANANVSAITHVDFKAKCDAFVADVKAMLGDGAAAAEGTALAADAQNETNAQIVQAVQTLTGEIEPAKLAAAVTGLKLRAESAGDSTELAREVAALRAESTKSKIVGMLAANRSKCTPAFEAWAMRQTDPKLVADVLQVTPNAPPAAAEPAPVQGAPSAAPVVPVVSLTPADLATCAMFNTKPEDFLKHKLERLAVRGG